MYPYREVESMRDLDAEIKANEDHEVRRRCYNRSMADACEAILKVMDAGGDPRYFASILLSGSRNQVGKE